ncbi:MAG TPA: CDP-glycerol glycerophosphotransferase family protein [Glaciihabitans sp.]|jgi:CDP-glycerol glycerophosphotransferase (TagB/SpsB family)|nr:CDP-glycerol glycerophosphotransferase family protein [Glaciihabitans sp.]
MSPAVTVLSIRITDDAEPALRLDGLLDEPATALTHVDLVGARLRLSGPVHTDGTAFHATIPLLASKWGGHVLPPPSGDYAVHFRMADAAVPGIRITQPSTPAQLHPSLFAAHLTTTLDSATVTFAAPLTAEETGADAQARLEADYRTANPEPINAVFFESFYGQNASCNPLAIDRELARVRPDVARYWSVADASVDVPPGAIPIVDGSAEWWRVRGAARLLVVNDWLRKRFRPRRFQTVLQTWHGTPLKRIALTRPGIRPRAAVATVLERKRWDILLSQNPYSTGIFRTAYAYFAAPWEEGYPRNDVLVHDDSAVLRSKLGISDTATVVLYAPTWRDDDPTRVDQLDVAAFSRELGPDYVVLIRGHSRSLRGGSDVHADNVIDVTTYPDASELFLVSDMLVTDYSSVMFDYSVTGKPIYFFTPDLDRYRNQMRGFYFDLLAASPGPVAQSAAELTALITNPGDTAANYAERYSAWQKKFNPKDDGGAASRVVARLLARGVLD